ERHGLLGASRLARCGGKHHCPAPPLQNRLNDFLLQGPELPRPPMPLERLEQSVRPNCFHGAESIITCRSGATSTATTIQAAASRIRRAASAAYLPFSQDRRLRCTEWRAAEGRRL